MRLSDLTINATFVLLVSICLGVAFGILWGRLQELERRVGYMAKTIQLTQGALAEANAHIRQMLDRLARRWDEEDAEGDD